MLTNTIVVISASDGTVQVYSDLSAEVLMLDEYDEGEFHLDGAVYNGAFASCNGQTNQASPIYNEIKLQMLNSAIKKIEKEIAEGDVQIAQIKGSQHEKAQKLVACRAELHNLKQIYSVEKQEIENKISKVS